MILRSFKNSPFSLVVALTAASCAATAQNDPSEPPKEGYDRLGHAYYVIAAFCAGTSTILALLSMFLHLKAYRRPDCQRLIIRILWMYVLFVDCGG
jgi:hypothetical protein